MNYLSKRNVIVYPEAVPNLGETFIIVVKQEFRDKKPKYMKGSNRYSTKTVLDGMYLALEHMYNEFKSRENER